MLGVAAISRDNCSVAAAHTYQFRHTRPRHTVVGFPPNRQWGKLTRQVRPECSTVSAVATQLVKHYRRLLLAFEADAVAAAGTQVRRRLDATWSQAARSICLSTSDSR